MTEESLRLLAELLVKTIVADGSGGDDPIELTLKTFKLIAEARQRRQKKGAVTTPTTGQPRTRRIKAQTDSVTGAALPIQPSNASDERRVPRAADGVTS